MHSGRWRARVAVLVALASLLASCGTNRSAELLRLAPRLDPDIASHLGRDDPKHFQRYAGELARGTIGLAYWSLRIAPPTTSIEEFLRVETALAPYTQQVIDALSTDPRIQVERRSYEAYRRRPVSERIAVIGLLLEIEAAGAVTTPTEAHAAELLQLIERCKPYSDIINVGDLYGLYTAMLPQLKRREEIPHWLNLGVQATLEFHDYSMACQMLGTLGAYYSANADWAPMRCAWDSALTYARRIDSWHEARILTFYAKYHRGGGRLAIARDLVLEAQDRCRELGATEKELRFSLDALHFFASLGCWEVVGRGLQRAEMTYAEALPRLSVGDALLEGTRLNVMRALHAAAIGRCTEARELALGVASRVDGWSLGPQRTAGNRLVAAKTLHSCGDLVEAQRLYELGLEECTRESVPFLDKDFGVALAEVLLARGELDAAAELLDRYTPPDGVALAVRHSLLALRVSMLRGDRALMFDRLRAALQQLAWLEMKTGSSAEGYFTLTNNDDLRRAAHEILDHSPEAGYGFEMWWRTPLKRRAALPVSEAAFVAELVADARRTVTALATRDAIHCVFDVRDDEIVRFTASGEGIVKDRLDYEKVDLRSRVRRAWSASSQPAANGNEIDPAGDLRQLSESLLPASIRSSDPARLFLVTATDCLAGFPFETLDVGTNGYSPLAATTDFAWVRYWNNVESTPGDSALVVYEPLYPASLRRRHSILNETLPSSALEAADVVQLLPRSTALRGADATKQNLVDRWQRARIVYIAGHFVQDPELPYMMFIPMSEDPKSHADAAYLEVADVRSTDLSRCRLVVLSGCASGAPYVNGPLVAPSLADVFADAGASAVVSTSWAVRDDTAAHFMREFVRNYVAGENDPIGALGRARRALAAEKPDPHFWAGFAVTISQLPQVQTLVQAESEHRPVAK